MASLPAERIISLLAPCLSPGRLARMCTALRWRVADTALVFENVSEPHNVSACLRTADALGIQHVHVIERWNDAFLSLKGVDKGAGQWLSLHRWRTTADCVSALKEQHFGIYATDLSGGAVDLDSAVRGSVARPSATGRRARVALAFGNEHRGVSATLRQAADVRLFVPMAGFVQSMNISVAAAVVAHAFMHRTGDYASWAAAAFTAMHEAEATAATAAADNRRASNTSLWQEPDHQLAPGGLEPLPREQHTAILARWLAATVLHADRILERGGARPPDL